MFASASASISAGVVSVPLVKSAISMSSEDPFCVVEPFLSFGEGGGGG